MREPRRWKVAAATGALIVATYFVDLRAGYEIRLFPLYFLPVGLASWHLGRVWGQAAAAGSALAWTLADVMAGHQYTTVAYLAWNAAIQFGTFSLTAWVLAHIARGLGAEKRLNARLAEALARALQPA